VLEGVKRASRDWAANDRTAAWLTHATSRLAAAERLNERPDLAANLEPTDREYLAECRKAESVARARTRRVRTFIYVLLGSIIIGLVGVIKQAYLYEQWNFVLTVWPYRVANFDPYVLTPERERALQPGKPFRECAKDCPEMIVIPAGSFMMGSPMTEQGRYDNEGPQHKVTIAKPFAVSKYDVTFADWDACYRLGGCPKANEGNMGGDTKPVINVSWDDAQQYVAWLSKMTRQPYRLLPEAEWEYAARAGTMRAYYWVYEMGKSHANCKGCGSQWDGKQTSPVGSFAANQFGLYDMAGNVWQWVQDCYHGNYDGAPTDGTAWTSGDCSRRVVRGGSWVNSSQFLRTANRFRSTTDGGGNTLGFRVGRTIVTP
jgi:formylglycine-generating enzyme required for sulfatase activity